MLARISLARTGYPQGHMLTQPGLLRQCSKRDKVNAQFEPGMLVLQSSQEKDAIIDCFKPS